MFTITKVPNENVCRKVSKIKGASTGSWLSTGLDCIKGSEGDKQFSRTFNNQPTLGLYISFKDLDGYETRIKFMRWTDKESPAPGFPVDLSIDTANILANEMMKVLVADGIQNAKKIYPMEK